MTKTAKNAKIAVYGAGAMGTVLGALLTKGGLSVDLITRNQDHVDGLKKEGATIVCEAENREFTVKVSALLPNEMDKKYDVIFFDDKAEKQYRNFNGFVAVFGRRRVGLYNAKRFARTKRCENRRQQSRVRRGNDLWRNVFRSGQGSVDLEN